MLYHLPFIDQLDYKSETLKKHGGPSLEDIISPLSVANIKCTQANAFKAQKTFRSANLWLKFSTDLTAAGPLVHYVVCNAPNVYSFGIIVFVTKLIWFD